MESKEWFEEMVFHRRWVMHLPTLSMGQAERYFTGKDGDAYTSPTDGKLIEFPVVQLSTGHSLIAAKASFCDLSDGEVEFFILATNNLNEWMRATCAMAAGRGLREPTAILLLTTMLRSASRALSQGNEGVVE